MQATSNQGSSMIVGCKSLETNFIGQDIKNISALFNLSKRIQATSNHGSGMIIASKSPKTPFIGQTIESNLAETEDIKR